MKRTLDIVAATFGLLIGSVILVPGMIAVWLQDWHSPFYVASRAGVNGRLFRMVKLRSMKILADASGVMSTAGSDPRITRVGRFVRRWKLDELTQLWNVLRGEMSLVGPRPQVTQDVARYTTEENRLLTVRPGITDIASIVFADEGEILRGADDPDQRYDSVIRPWKSRLALLYVDRGPSVMLDIQLVWLTIVTIVHRETALRAVSKLVRNLGGNEDLVRVALRQEPLREALPPGAGENPPPPLTA